MLVVGHKAPHRCWCPSIQNLGRAKQYADAIDPPANLEDDFADRPEFLKMTEQTLLNHFNVWSDEHLIKEVVPEDIQKMLSCPESKTLHTQYDWEMPEWVRMDPQQKEAWYNYHKARTVQLVKDIKTGKSKRSATFCCAAGAIIWKTIWAPFFPWTKASARSWTI